MPEELTVNEALDGLAASISGLGTDLGTFINDVRQHDLNQNNAIAQANASLQVLQGQEGADQAEIARLRQALNDLQNSNINTDVVSRLEGLQQAVNDMGGAVRGYQEPTAEGQDTGVATVNLGGSDQGATTAETTTTTETETTGGVTTETTTGGNTENDGA